METGLAEVQVAGGGTIAAIVKWIHQRVRLARFTQK